MGVKSEHKKRQIAIIAKHPFYIEDIRNLLLDLEIEIISSEDLSQLQKYSEGGYKFDYIFFPHYSKIIPSLFLEKNICIGFHTGDLPSDRGGSPIQNKILQGRYNTVVSALRLVPEIDAGDILCCENISLEFGTIDEILKNISKKIARMVRLILTESLTPVPQSNSASTLPRLGPQDSELNLEVLDPRGIYDRIRMLDGLDYPSAYIAIGPYRILLSDAQFLNGNLTFRSQLEET